ncbi:MAG: hypothetical protein AAFX87_10580 [Bacteroidota bacterium]
MKKEERKKLIDIFFISLISTVLILAGYDWYEYYYDEYRLKRIDIEKSLNNEQSVLRELIEEGKKVGAIDNNGYERHKQQKEEVTRLIDDLYQMR